MVLIQLVCFINFVGWLVLLSVLLLKQLWMNFHEIFENYIVWDNKQFFSILGMTMWIMALGIFLK